MRGKEGDSLKTTLSKYCERTGSDTLLREWDAERNDGKTVPFRVGTTHSQRRVHTIDSCQRTGADVQEGL